MTEPINVPVPCHEDPELAQEDPDLAEQPEELEQRLRQFLRAQPPEVAEQLTAAGLAKSPWYPPANRTKYFFGDRLSAVNFDHVRIALLHSTETSGMPGYQGGLTAPNLTGQPNFARKRIDWFHHFRLNQSSRALKHPQGTVSTNTTSIVQVELIGTTVKGGPGLYLYDAPGWWYRDVAAFLKFMHDDWGVPLVTPRTWKMWDASYGARNGIRYTTDSEWLAAHGVIAHMHARNNDHGDVPLQIEKLLQLAGNEEDMPLTEPEWARLNKMIDESIAANNGDLIRALLRTDLGKVGGNDSVQIALQDGLANSRHLVKTTDAIKARLDTPTATD